MKTLYPLVTARSNSSSALPQIPGCGTSGAVVVGAKPVSVVWSSIHGALLSWTDCVDWSYTRGHVQLHSLVPVLASAVLEPSPSSAASLTEQREVSLLQYLLRPTSDIIVHFTSFYVFWAIIDTLNQVKLTLALISTADSLTLIGQVSVVDLQQWFTAICFFALNCIYLL